MQLIITYIIHVRIIRKDVEEKIMSKQMTEKQIQKLRLKIIILRRNYCSSYQLQYLFLAAVLEYRTLKLNSFLKKINIRILMNGLLIGRFQPFHLGHLDALRFALVKS